MAVYFVLDGLVFRDSCPVSGQLLRFETLARFNDSCPVLDWSGVYPGASPGHVAEGEAAEDEGEERAEGTAEERPGEAGRRGQRSHSHSVHTSPLS